MILAFYSIFSLYGFWMPNDPRGSGSDYVASWELFRYGSATKTDSRHSVAAVPHDVVLRRAAKGALQHPPVLLNDRQIDLAVDGFARACAQSGYRLYACAVMPDHAHVVIGRHHRNIRQIVGHLKGQATLAVKRAEQWTGGESPMWGEHGWNVFLDDETAVRRAIQYVEDNPLKEGRPRQKWAIVAPFLI
jgi:REP element-mobilizing transposase RayT